MAAYINSLILPFPLFCTILCALMNTENLNPEQAKAAHTINGPVLIIAAETLDVYGVGTLFSQIKDSGTRDYYLAIEKSLSSRSTVCINLKCLSFVQTSQPYFIARNAIISNLPRVIRLLHLGQDGCSLLTQRMLAYLSVLFA